MSAQIIKSPYTRLAQIKEELTKRRGDLNLQKEVEKFFGAHIPKFLAQIDAPLAIMSRPIFSPTMEVRFFLDMIQSYKLTPLLLEYPGDFVAISPDKLDLAKLRFFKKTKKNKTQMRVLNIVDFQKWEGKPMRDVQTIFGEGFVEFHHRFFQQYFPQYPVHDISDWFNVIRKEYENFYSLGYLLLGVCHGILFENYMFRDRREVKFFVEKVQPSIDEIERVFGLKPLIYPVIPLQEEEDHNWHFYPELPAEN